MKFKNQTLFFQPESPYKCIEFARRANVRGANKGEILHLMDKLIKQRIFVILMVIERTKILCEECNSYIWPQNRSKHRDTMKHKYNKRSP